LSYKAEKDCKELADFKDDPKASTEGKLEATQMAWLEEYQDSQNN
jgi:FeS assembly protein IscX